MSVGFGALLTGVEIGLYLVLCLVRYLGRFESEVAWLLVVFGSALASPLLGLLVAESCTGLHPRAAVRALTWLFVVAMSALLTMLEAFQDTTTIWELKALAIFGSLVFAVGFAAACTTRWRRREASVA